MPQGAWTYGRTTDKVIYRGYLATKNTCDIPSGTGVPVAALVAQQPGVVQVLGAKNQIKCDKVN